MATRKVVAIRHATKRILLPVFLDCLLSVKVKHKKTDNASFVGDHWPVVFVVLRRTR